MKMGILIVVLIVGWIGLLRILRRITSPGNRSETDLLVQAFNRLGSALPSQKNDSKQIHGTRKKDAEHERR